MEEWGFEVEWSQILCSLVGFTKTNTELFLLRHMTFKRGLSFLTIFLVHTDFKLEPEDQWSCKRSPDILA